MEGLLAAGAGFAASGLLVWLAPSGLLSRRKTIRLMVRLAAGAAAVGGAIAEPAATGLDGLDVVLRAGVCAGVVLLAAPANRWLLVGAAVLAVVGSVGSSAIWLAAAGLGVALGPASVRVKAPAIKAVAVALTTQAALRFSWPDPSRGTALLALVLFSILTLGGLARSPSRRRQRVVNGAPVVIGIAAVAVLLGGLAALVARSAVQDGVRAASTGLTKARQGDADGSARSLQDATRSFTSAERRLDSWWAKPAMIVPLVAQQSRALRDMAASGARVTRVGARTIEVVSPQGLQISGGVLPIERIARLRQPAQDTVSVLTDAEERLAGARSPWLLPPVASRLSVLNRRVTEARGAARATLTASEVAPALLGSDRPRRYFLAIQTPSELRGSGGFIGNFGEISADRGRLSLDRVGPIRELVNKSGSPPVEQLGAPPDYVARYEGFFGSASVWQNLNMSPDFPTVARIIANVYPNAGGRPVDGVVAIDPLGLGALLGVVGPVQVPSWPVPITADNAARVLLYEQYVSLEGAVREDFLSGVTEAVWRRLITSRASIAELARALAPMVTQKHVLLSTIRPEEERLLADLGTRGAMTPVKGDFLGLVTQNAGGNKIDWFLRRSVEYDARVDTATGEVRATARIRLHNGAPAGGLPPYVIGSATRPPLAPGTNKLYLSLYSPLSFSNATLDGRPLSLESEVELGRNVYSTFVTVPPGGSSAVEIQLTGQLDLSAGYQLTFFHQPFLAPDSLSASTQKVNYSEAGATQARGRRKTEKLEVSSDRTLFPLAPKPNEIRSP